MIHTVFTDRRAVIFAAAAEMAAAREKAALWTGLPAERLRTLPFENRPAFFDRLVAEDESDNLIVLCEAANGSADTAVSTQAAETGAGGPDGHTDAAKAAFEAFKERFKIIRAGGGLVRHGDRYLYIYRRGFWDLPKGKQEKDEDIDDTALREVAEETGLSPLLISNELPTTYHLIRKKNETILKECVWYAMETFQSMDAELVATPPELTPQTEEDIMEAVWLTQTEVLARCGKMYPSIACLTQVYFEA